MDIDWITFAKLPSLPILVVNANTREDTSPPWMHLCKALDNMNTLTPRTPTNQPTHWVFCLGSS